MVTLREFTELDWTGFAGAERFADGSAPLTTELDGPGDGHSTLVADAKGVTLYFYGNDGETAEWWACWLTEEVETRTLAHMLATLGGVSYTGLGLLGFEEMGAC